VKSEIKTKGSLATAKFGCKLTKDKVILGELGISHFLVERVTRVDINVSAVAGEMEAFA